MITIVASISKDGWMGSPCIHLDVAGTGDPGVAALVLAAIFFYDLERFSGARTIPQCEAGRVSSPIFGKAHMLGEARYFVDRFNENSQAHATYLGEIMRSMGRHP